VPQDGDKRRSEVQEALLQLYLRLNGYFVTGFIVHSPNHGKNVAEIDALAVRHPQNCEPEREVGPASFLEPSSGLTDLLICEVKAKGRQLHFNERFRNDVSAISVVLRWAGLFEEKEVMALARLLQPKLAPTDHPKQEIPSVPGPRNTRIRVVLCSPERQRRFPNQVKFIHGEEIFSYVTKCLCPETPRPGCAVRYDFTGWGRNLEPIVRFFKNRGPAAAKSKIAELYAELEVPVG